MELMIYSWKETNGGKRMLDMKTLKTMMLETKVLDENKGDYELVEVVNMK